MAQAADLRAPLYDLMAARGLKSTVIHPDDPSVPVWYPTLPQTRTVRFWAYIKDLCNPSAVHDDTPRRTRDGPERFLKGSGVTSRPTRSPATIGCVAGSDMIEVACWAHMKRDFVRNRGPPRRAGARGVGPHPSVRDGRACRRGTFDRGPSGLASEEACPDAGEYRGVVGRAGPPRAVQEPDRPGDILRPFAFHPAQQLGERLPDVWFASYPPVAA